MRYFCLLACIGATFLIQTNALAVQRTVQAQWSYQSISGLAGFRLYHQNTPACETQDPKATSIQCTLDIPDGETWFTVTAFYDDGTESDHSTAYTYTFFSSTLNAAFTTNSSGGTAPHTVIFDAVSSTGENISSYTWLFGDGETATGRTTSHTFTTAGIYTVTLEVAEDSGATDRQTTQITITDPASGNIPPTAAISSSAGIGTAPFAIELDASGSTDSDGRIISYSWDLGDGTTASGALITHIYATSGSYTPQVTVTDNGGLKDSASIPVLVQPAAGDNVLPTASISASANRGKVPLKVVFSGAKSTDPDGTISSYSWNFGDGSSAWGKTVDHLFKTAGKYRITLIVRDNNGADSVAATYDVEVLAKNDTLSNNAIKLQPIINLLLNEGDAAEN